MQQVPNYRNITATVRTPRCTILINEASSYWLTAANGAIRHASAVWGGRYFLLVPTDGTRIKDKFWEILEAYNPDHITTYTPTAGRWQSARTSNGTVTLPRLIAFPLSTPLLIASFGYSRRTTTPRAKLLFS